MIVQGLGHHRTLIIVPVAQRLFQQGVGSPRELFRIAAAAIMIMHGLVHHTCTNIMPAASCGVYTTHKETEGKVTPFSSTFVLLLLDLDHLLHGGA